MLRIVKLQSIDFVHNGIVFRITFYNPFQFSEGGLTRNVNITIFLKIYHSVNTCLKHVSCFWTTSPYIVLHLACKHWYENLSKFHSTELVQTIQNIHPVSFLKVSFQYTCNINVAFYGLPFWTLHCLFLSSFCLPIKKLYYLLWKFLAL